MRTGVTLWTMKMRSAFALPVVLFAVVFVVLVGGGVTLAWRTIHLDFLSSESPADTTALSSESSPEDSTTTAEDSTKDWESYTSIEFSFFFQYPSEWEISSLSNKEFLIFESQEGLLADDGRMRPCLEVFLVGGYGSDYGYDAVLGPGVELEWEIKESTATVGGRLVKRTEHTYKSSGVVEVARIFFGSLSDMRMEFYPLDGKLELFNLVLGTVEFL